MNGADVRALSEQELRTRLAELREEQFRLRFRGSMMQLESPHLPRQIRRDIARMETVLRERELAATKAGESA